MSEFSVFLKSIAAKYKVYFCTLFVVNVFASVWSIAVNYSIKEIIDAIQMNSDVAVLVMLFILYKLMHHGMFFIARLLDAKYKPVIFNEVITNTYTKILDRSLH